MILFGHPTGNPNSHHAALAHFEAGRLASFCVPWMPTSTQLRLLRVLPGMKGWTLRLERRFFQPLLDAPRREGILGEWCRMLRRLTIGNETSEGFLSDEANHWVMRTMARESINPGVTAVHAYEDCSLLPFQTARKMGKVSIYDMPTGYFQAWEATQRSLFVKFADWVPPKVTVAGNTARLDQKRQEMELADFVLVPSSFVARTIRQYHAHKRLALAPYGVDLSFWRPNGRTSDNRRLRFIYAGHVSVMKGIPVLIEAWHKADLKDAELLLVGPWRMSTNKRSILPPSISVLGPCSSQELRQYYQSSDIFVFPSFFEGFGLVLLEAMACGLPVITTPSTGGADILTNETGRVIETGDPEQLAEALRWFAHNRDCLLEMSLAARRTAESMSWTQYRMHVNAAFRDWGL